MLRRMYATIVAQMSKQLGQLDRWLEATAGFADDKKFEADVFFGLGLAPNQFGFGRQVQIACDTAKKAAARLTGKDAPVHDDSEKTLTELRTRVSDTIAYLDGFSAADFDNAASQVITQPRWKGQTMTGADFFVEHAIPNFYFHLTTAYAILRHNGVALGKRDFLGALTKSDPT